MINPLRTTIAAFLVASIASFCPAAPAEPVAEPHPAIWLLSDNDTKIWLFGTNHVLPNGFVWRSAALEDVIEQADELILETLDDPRLDAKPAIFVRMMTRAEPQPILDRIAPEYRREMRLVAKAMGVPLTDFDTIETWGVGFMLMSMSEAVDDDGDGEYDAQSGVEDELTVDFEERGKPIGEIESAMIQFNFFRHMSAEGQRSFLESLLAEFQSADDQDAALENDILDDWAAGDLAALDAQCDDDAAFSGEVREVLIDSRNHRWADWLIDRLDRPGNLLFAVGACHLAGRGSVQRLLGARGFAVERVN